MTINGMPVVTPSKLNNWNGTPLNGSQFTVQQSAAMGRWRARIMSARQRYNLPEVYIVEREGTAQTLMGDLPCTIKIPCPVVSCRKDRTMIQVIAPNGYTEWVKWK